MSLPAWVLVAALLAPQAGGDGIARWKLDGRLDDAGIPTRAVGRIEYIDSPITGAGQMAVFNGVDAFLEVDPPGRLGVGAADFTICAWFYSLERRPSPLLARKGWSLDLIENGVLRFTTLHGTLTTPPSSAPAAQWNHVAVSVKRGSEGKLSRIFVNGAEVASGNIAEGDLDPEGAPLLMGKGAEEGRLFAGFMDEIRIYAFPLGAEHMSALTDAGLPWLRAKPQAQTPFGGRFELHPHDVVAFTGGENARSALQDGYLETLLALASTGKHVHFRDMAWEADTVYEQLRPLNFGSWTDQFRRTGTSVIFAQFGQIESLEGKAGVDRFTAAYEALLSEFERTTKRIVLMSPSPFARGLARQPDPALRNADLALYVAAIRKLAQKHGFLFVDLTTKPMNAAELTRDGVHLNGAGQWIAALETARQLEVPGMSDLDGPDPRGVLRRETFEKVRSAILYKNVLWNDSWRPANWAFLNGDRMEQPSSRDHQDRRLRWFPVEIQRLPAMTLREEAKVEILVEAAQKR